jgi:hypothetical protein
MAQQVVLTHTGTDIKRIEYLPLKADGTREAKIKHFVLGSTVDGIDATRGLPGEVLLRAALDEQAAVVARLILAPPVHAPVIDRSKRLLERVEHAIRFGSRVRDLMN